MIKFIKNRKQSIISAILLIVLIFLKTDILTIYIIGVLVNLITGIYSIVFKTKKYLDTKELSSILFGEEALKTIIILSSFLSFLAPITAIFLYKKDE